MKAKEFIIELKKESKPRNFVAKNASLAGKAGQHKDKKKAEKQGDVKHKKELATMESALSELSTEKLAQYKKAAGADASAADKVGNTKKADKRFSGIVNATKKQFANDKKGMTEGPNDGSKDNFTIDDIKRLEKIQDFETLKAQAKQLIKGKPARRMKPEKISFFYNRVDTLRNPLAVIKMMYDMMLAGEGNRVIGSRNSMSSNSYRQRFGEQGTAEASLGDYREKALKQKAQSRMGAMFNDPDALATFNKRERGLNRLKARDEVARKSTADKQMADNIAKLPELKAEYERMKAEYKSLGGSNWQYADREQNLTDRERKARSMEGPMNNLWRTISAAEKAQKSQGVEEASKMQFAGAKVGHKEGPAGQWRNDGSKKNKPAKPGDLVGDGM